MPHTVYILLTLLFFSPQAYPKPYSPRQIGDGWEVANPGSVDMDIKKLNRMSQLIKSKYRGVDSIILVRKHKLVYEKYFNGNRIKKPHTLTSAGKSILSILLGIAIDEGHIQNVDQPIYRYMPYKQYKHWDLRKQAIQLKHLLTMTAGWDCGDSPLSLDNRCGKIMYKQKEAVKWVLDLPMKHTPGTIFNYSDGIPAVLRAILMLSTKQLYMDYYYEKLLKPLNIDLPQSANSLKSRDMAKLGQLYLNQGQWQGKQIVSADWVNASTQAQFTFNHGSNSANNFTGFAKAYGYYWWLKDISLNKHSYPSYMAVGNGGQYIIVIPTLDLVIVMTGQNYNNAGLNKAGSPYQLVHKFIIPSIKQATPH